MPLFGVEQRAISWVNSLTAFVGCQDMYCSLTSEAKSSSLNLYSDLGGEYKDKKYTFFKEFEFEVIHKFRDLSLIAQETGMKNLSGVLKQLSILPA